MFVSEALKTHLETSATVNIESLILAEWNMNMPGNIFKVGNYRYRPNTTGSIGVYGEPILPPARFTLKSETFFDGCDVAYIKGGGNSGNYRLAFSSPLDYSKNQLTGIGNQIINTSAGWEGSPKLSGQFSAIPLNTTINSRSTFNGGNSLNAKNGS